MRNQKTDAPAVISAEKRLIRTARIVPRGQQKLPGPCHQHEERVSRRMRNPEDVRGRDVLAGVPERRRGRERHCVQGENPGAGQQGSAVRDARNRGRGSIVWRRLLGGSRLAHDADFGDGFSRAFEQLDG